MGVKEEAVHIPLLTFKENQSLKDKCTYKTGGNARYFAEVYSVKALSEIVESAVINGTDYKVIGLGSNVIFSDKGYDGLIISLKSLNSIARKDCEITAMSGALLSDLIAFSYNLNLTGLESFAGIPATVGGAVCRNVGAFNKSISDVIKEVCVLSGGKLVKFSADECGFSYRNSKFINGKDVILSATFSLKNGSAEEIMENTDKVLSIRRESQPTGKSCGSVFKNGDGYKAGELIEKAGLKGYTIGGATVSNKHANFILTKDGATSTDIYNLINYVKKKVKEVFGITLNEEVELIGEF